MPVLKVFLGALFTYQVIYLSWLKLEEIEQKHNKDGTLGCSMTPGHILMFWIQKRQRFLKAD